MRHSSQPLFFRQVNTETVSVRIVRITALQPADTCSKLGRWWCNQVINESEKSSPLESNLQISTFSLCRIKHTKRILALPPSSLLLIYSEILRECRHMIPCSGIADCLEGSARRFYTQFFIARLIGFKNVFKSVCFPAKLLSVYYPKGEDSFQCGQKYFVSGKNVALFSKLFITLGLWSQ